MVSENNKCRISMWCEDAVNSLHDTLFDTGGVQQEGCSAFQQNKGSLLCSTTSTGMLFLLLFFKVICCAALA
jgi:type II secretory pathway pseudopilin PulG